MLSDARQWRVSYFPRDYNWAHVCWKMMKMDVDQCW